MPRQPIIKETLFVEFIKVECGRLWYEIKLKDTTFKECFHHTLGLDLPDFKHWLEALAIGVEQASFEYCAEGPEFKFDMKRRTYEFDEITISNLYDEPKMLINGNVDRKQVIKAFYLALLNFGTSEKFKSSEWEIETLGERMCMNGKYTQTELLDIIIDYERNEIKELFFKVAPSYMVSFPAAKDKGDELAVFWEYAQDNEIPDGHTMIRTPDEYQIPEDYDFWSTVKKNEFLEEIFKEVVSHFQGMKIIDFRSSIIEEYLEKE